MRRPILIAMAVTLGLLVTALLTTPTHAVPRRTPVEVVNPLALSTDGNTVKAEQLGSWSFFLSGGTAAVTQSGGWSVGITGTPNVNVANTPSVTVSNTPNVSVTNSPTVKIDSTTNIVKTQTATNSVMIWTGNQTVAAGGTLWSPYMDCSGYNEIRFVIHGSVSSSSVKVRVGFRNPTGTNGIPVGEGNFAAPATTICSDANFTASADMCTMRVPVMSNTCYLVIYNYTASPVTIYGYSWAHMVN